MLTQLKVYHQLFQLIKKQRVNILVQLSELLQKYMIIYVFYMPVLEDQYVQRMGLKLHLKLLSKWWTKLWHIQKKVDYKYLLQLFQVEKENMLSYLMICKEGYVRVRVNGETYDITEEFNLDKNKKHSIEVVIDRIILKEGVESRLADSLESALPLGEGRV